MNNTGIVRKIDELGRIVIPKEIRKSLNIRNGEDVEIFVESNKIVLKKYEKLLNIAEKAQMYIDSFSKLLEYNIIVVDYNKIIASSNKSLVNKKYNEKIYTYFESRQNSVYEGQIVDNNVYKAYMSPIIVDADLLGEIIVYGEKEVGDKEKLLANVINILLSSLIS